MILNTETQVVFNQSIKNHYTITNDSWCTDLKISIHGNELEVDIASVQRVNSPKHLIAGFQTADRIGAFNKNKKISIFDNVNVRKYFCEKDGYRYPKDAVLTTLPEKDYLDQIRDLILFYKNTLKKNY